MKMKNLLYKVTVLILSVTTLFILVGCAKKNTIDDLVIVVAASESPHSYILEQTRAYIESKGYELKIIVFNDYVIPNEVTQSEEVDANFFQHEPYLLDFNLNHHTDLVNVLQVHFEPLALYQAKRTSISNLENAKIAIANDTSNGARGLLLLQEQGIIKLDPSKGTNVTVNDIIENVHNVKIIELDPAIIPVQLADLDFAVINGNYALAADISKDKILASESKDSEAALLYSNIIAVKKNYKDKEAIRILIEALSQTKISEFIANSYDGVVVGIN
jgi:D-methionine transport system substrate-binding protein